jgi:hypothetical protein
MMACDLNTWRVKYSIRRERVNPSFVKQLLYTFTGLTRRGLITAETYNIPRVTTLSQCLPCTRVHSNGPHRETPEMGTNRMITDYILICELLTITRIFTLILKRIRST